MRLKAPQLQIGDLLELLSPLHLCIEFRKRTGGEAYVRQMALKAMELSKNRAAEIRKVLNEKYSIPAARIDVVGRGWEEPLSGDSEQNRRVEVQWFTLE